MSDDEYGVEIPDEEKVKIASDFILNAPPGEFNEVFNDVRVLLNNDELLKTGASGAFKKYNEDQFTPVKLPSGGDALVTKHGHVSDQTYFDPRSKTNFTFDHLRKEASNAEESSEESGLESLRAAFESAVTEYVKAHYPDGSCAVYAKGGSIVVCIEDHKFQPNNFWNGRWRSEWTFDKSSGEATGLLKVQVHYYEDGNVQLRSKKEVVKAVGGSDDETIASKFVKAAETAESEYQSAISENYVTMSDTTFKALRRALPVTRTKVDWNKILNYRIGKELNK
eukprot:m.263788 g.263788  ORF g.263788 m.263788 type:complete len:281 (+) comp27229_c0_seq1:176-1018(+)